MKKLFFRLLIISLAIPSVCLAKTLDQAEKAQCATGEGLEFNIKFNLSPFSATAQPMKVKYITDGRTQFEWPTLGSNYYFHGWYSDANKTNRIYAVWQLPVKINRDATTGCATSIDDVTIYAKVDRDGGSGSCITLDGGSVGITYVLGGGLPNQEGRWGIGVNPATNTLLTPTREGYVFDGWYLDQNYIFSYEKLGVPEYRAGTYCDGDGGYEHITLYAKWLEPLQAYEKIFDNLLFSDITKAKEEATKYNGQYHKIEVNGNVMALTLMTKNDANEVVPIVVPYTFFENTFEYSDDNSKNAYERVQSSMANIMLVYAGLVEGGMKEDDAMKAMLEYDFSKATMTRNGIAITYGDVVDYTEGGKTTQVKLIDNLKMSGNGVYVDGLPKSELGSLIGDPSLFGDLPIELLSGTDNGETDYGTTENPKTGVYDYVIYLIIAMPVAYTLIRLINRHRKFQHIN